MKKSIVSILVILCVFGVLYSQDLSVGLKIGYFIPSNQEFKDIYGNGFQLGGELGLDIWEKISIWIGSSYFSKKGELSFTEEKVTLKIFSVNLGVCYRITKDAVIPYVGAGIGLYSFREAGPHDTVTDTKFGYLGEAGVLVGLTERLFFEFEINYNYCKIKPIEEEINIGGIGTLFGLKYYL